MKEEEKKIDSENPDEKKQVDFLKSEQSQKPENYKALLPAKPSYPNQLSLVLVYYRPLFPHMVLPLLIQKKIFNSLKGFFEMRHLFDFKVWLFFKDFGCF